jgi:hypothetical protein
MPSPRIKPHTKQQLPCQSPTTPFRKTCFALKGKKHMQEQNLAKICYSDMNTGHPSSMQLSLLCFNAHQTTTQGITRDWPDVGQPTLTQHTAISSWWALDCGKKPTECTAITHLHENTMQTQSSAAQCSSCPLS